MVCEGRDVAEEHKYDEGKECYALDRLQFVELGVWLSAPRGSAQGAPFAFEVGSKSASVGDGCVSVHPALFRSPVSNAIMVKPRQRLISRRGSGRGGTSRPSVDNASSRCCRCLCHRVAEANPLQSSQFMDSGNPDAGSNPLPAFGTAVFSFNSSQANSRINAHVSVLFLEEPVEEVGEQPRPQLHQAESSRAAEGMPEDRPKPDIDPPATQEAPSSEKAKVDWGPPRKVCAGYMKRSRTISRPLAQSLPFIRCSGFAMKRHVSRYGSRYVLNVSVLYANSTVQCVSTPLRGSLMKILLFSSTPLNGMTTSALTAPQRFKAPAWAFYLCGSAPAWVSGLKDAAPARVICFHVKAPAWVINLVVWTLYGWIFEHCKSRVPSPASGI